MVTETFTRQRLMTQGACAATEETLKYRIPVWTPHKPFTLTLGFHRTNVTDGRQRDARFNHALICQQQQYVATVTKQLLCRLPISHYSY